MYSITGYLTEDIDIVDEEHPLVVTSCGIYRLIHCKFVRTTRPQGRLDYQLLYVAAGKAYFQFEGEYMEVPAGHIVLYRPGTVQYYEYFLEDQPEICWIHFTGSEAGQLMDRIGFDRAHVVSCDNTANCMDIFKHIIQELQLKRPCYEELLELYFRQLLTEIQRSHLENLSTRYKHSKKIEEIVHYFNEAYAQDICIEDYAANRHMSVCWLIRIFKRYMGITPLQYIASVRINKAKELLEGTDYSIQEIGNIVGYDNPLYFSRIFKKLVGCSPSQYRGNKKSG